jgi:hypothetical protein
MGLGSSKSPRELAAGNGSMSVVSSARSSFDFSSSEIRLLVGRKCNHRAALMRIIAKQLIPAASPAIITASRGVDGDISNSVSKGVSWNRSATIEGCQESAHVAQ